MDVCGCKQACVRARVHVCYHEKAAIVPVCTGLLLVVVLILSFYFGASALDRPEGTYKVHSGLPGG